MSAPAPPRPLRFFLVENDPDSRAMLMMLLDSWGHTGEAAATMSDALAHLSQHRCDVLLSDIGLPDGDGWQLMERLRALELQHHAGFAIAMSGYGMGSDLERSRAAGYRRHLIKPMAIDELERALLEAAHELQASGP
ncbi:MAG TPA: response regulator [Burkholderiaceae bacterium]|jgi:CheY-like chemotaxis protein